MPEEIVVWDGERTEIEPALRPSESRRIAVNIVAPAEPGRYLLEWDLVEEGVTWFSQRGFRTPLRDVDVFVQSFALPSDESH